jgi:hypothetical protein
MKVSRIALLAFLFVAQSALHAEVETPIGIPTGAQSKDPVAAECHRLVEGFMLPVVCPSDGAAQRALASVSSDAKGIAGLQAYESAHFHARELVPLSEPAAGELGELRFNDWVLIDQDNNPASGCLFNGVGAELAILSTALSSAPGVLSFDSLACGVAIHTGDCAFSTQPDQTCFAGRGAAGSLEFSLSVTTDTLRDIVPGATHYALSQLRAGNGTALISTVCPPIPFITTAQGGPSTTSCASPLNVAGPDVFSSQAKALVSLQFFRSLPTFTQQGPPMITAFSSNPVTGVVDQSVDFSWSSADATSCRGTRGNGTNWASEGLATSGVRSIRMPTVAGPVEFGLICVRDGLSSSEAFLTVEVEAGSGPLMLELQGPATATTSTDFALTWSSNLSGSGACLPQGGQGTAWSSLGSLPVNGTRVLQGPATPGVRSFELNCSGNGQQISASTAVNFEAPVLPPPPQPPVGISLGADGRPPNGASRRASLTRDGVAISFESVSNNINAALPSGSLYVPSPDTSNIYVAVEGQSRAVAVSVDEAGRPLTMSSRNAQVSGDRAPNGLPQTVVFETDDGQVRTFAGFGGLGRIGSTNGQGTPGNGPSRNPDVDDSGSWLIFESDANNLVPDDNNGSTDIFAKNAMTGEVFKLSEGALGEPANGPSNDPVISADGSMAFFQTAASNVGPPAGFPRRRLCGRAVRNPGGRTQTACIEANADLLNPQVNSNGEFGVFESDASNLEFPPLADTNGVRDVFWFQYDKENGNFAQIRRISKTQSGIQGNGPSRNASIDGDGQRVVFQSDATNLVVPDNNGGTDSFQKFIATGVIQRVGNNERGEQADGDSREPAMSGDGSRIGLGTEAENVLPGDSNGVEDVVAVDNSQIGGADEPGLSRAPLPAPNPPNASCPAGFFVAAVEDGAGPGVSSGTFGMEVLLDQPGTRRLAGGLNFGALVDVSQRGFAAVNIANAGNENQRLNISLTGNPSSNPSGTLPVRVIIERRSGGTATQVFQTDVGLRGSQAFEASILVPPGFYVASVAPQGFAAEASGGEPEGRFLFSLTTSFIDRPGGGFQGGAVVGGYHAPNPFAGSSGFAAFCLATPHSVSVKVLSAPTYGVTGARDLRLRLRNGAQEVIYSVP